MYTSKSYMGNIFFEYLLQNNSTDCVVLFSGFPSSNNLEPEMEWFYQNGFHVISPRYEGTFQSKGKFLEKNLYLEMESFLCGLHKERFVDLWDMTKKSCKINQFILVGNSFSGALACALATSKKIPVKTLLLFSPVLDFSKHNERKDEQDLTHLVQFVKKAYQNLYRFQFKDLTKELSKFKQLSSSYYTPKLEVPVLIFHDRRDNSVSIRHSLKFKRQIKNVQLINHSLGHGLKIKMLETNSRRTLKFCLTGSKTHLTDL